MKLKKYLTMFTVAALACSSTVPAMAQTTGSTNVSLTVNGSGDTEEPEPIAVKVPSELNLEMDETGAVQITNETKIQNFTTDSSIKLELLNVEGVNGWDVVDYDTDLSNEETGTKKISMEFNGDGTDDSGNVSLTEGNWVIESEGELPLDINVKIPKQNESDKTNIAVINYTFDATTDTPSIPPEDDESVLSNNWDSSTKMLPGSSKAVKFSWDSTKDDTHIVSIESSNPEIADISEASTFASLDYNGEKSYTVEGVGRGTTTITATLDTGETSSFTVNVYELAGGDSGENIEIEVPGTDLQPGDNTSDSDITIEIPVTNPDGSDDVIVVKPEIPSTDLEEGRNEIEVTVDVNGVTINITIVINVTSPVEENPSDGLQQSVEEAQAMGFTFSSYEDGLQIDSFENKQFKSEINVPEQIGDFKVLKIGDSAFEGESNLTKITLPNTIKEIGQSAFENCIGLDGSTYDLSELEKIGADAFRYVNNLNITLSDVELTGAAEVQGSTCRVTPFRNTTGLNITFTEGVEVIDTAMFSARRTSDGSETGSDSNNLVKNATINLPSTIRNLEYENMYGVFYTKNTVFNNLDGENTVFNINTEYDDTDKHMFKFIESKFSNVNWRGEFDGSYSFVNNFDNTGKALKGQEVPVTFTWKSTDDLKYITDIISSDTDVVTILEDEKSTLDTIQDSKTYILNCVGTGTAKITATLNNGMESEFEIEVWESESFNEIDKTIDIELTSYAYAVGEDLSTSDTPIYI